MGNHLKNLKLPNAPSTAGLRAMTPADVPAVHKLLNDSLTARLAAAADAACPLLLVWLVRSSL
jgi:hypothetical protein